MNCPNCGQPIDQGASFCGNCGQPVAASTVPSQPQQAVPFNPARPYNPTPQPPFPMPVAPPNPTYSGATPDSGIQSMVPVMANVSMGVPQPAYALPQQNIQTHKGETRAIIGLVAAVLGLPGALIPILGLILGITGLVIGTTSRHIKKGISTTSIVIGIAAILLSLAAWTYTVMHDPRFKKNKLSSTMQQVDTPCYSTQLSVSFHVDTASDSCKLSAANGDTTASSSSIYSVNSVKDSTLDASNFEKWAQQGAPTIVKAASTTGRTYNLTSQKSTTFAGKPAHIIIADSNQHTQVELMMILYNAPNGDNVFFITNAVAGTNANLTELEKNFSWK